MKTKNPGIYLSIGLIAATILGYSFLWSDIIVAEMHIFLVLLLIMALLMVPLFSLVYLFWIEKWEKNMSIQDAYFKEKGELRNDCSIS